MFYLYNPETELIVYKTNQFHDGIKDILARTHLQGYVSDKDLKVGDEVPSIVGNPSYAVGDIVFHPQHEKNFVVKQMRAVVTQRGTEFYLPILEELNPSNPKFPIEVTPVYDCTYPIVS